MYHVLDFRALPARRCAILAAGLPESSRTMRRLSGRPPLDTLLLAHVLDTLRWLQWAQTKDGAKNRRRPASVAELLTTPAAGTGKATWGDVFDTGAAFDAAWKEATGNG